jgi:uncharacterized UBP type Zn finger protein
MVAPIATPVPVDDPEINAIIPDETLPKADNEPDESNQG